jgi:dihydrofolate reductase
MITLDGFYEGPNGEIDWHNVDEEFSEYSLDLLNNIDIVLLGRKTYQLMADYWQSGMATTSQPLVANQMNSLPKVVCSNSLDKAGWSNTTLIKGNIIPEISKIKQEPGEGIAVFGSSNLATTLIDNNLIDEYHLVVNPVMLGQGKVLFKGMQQQPKLKLMKATPFKSGNVLLCYKSA